MPDFYDLDVELPLVPLPKPADLMAAIDADPDIAAVHIIYHSSPRLRQCTPQQGASIVKHLQVSASSKLNISLGIVLK